MRDYDTLINTAMLTLANIAIDEAKRVCPVRTGRLKRSINLHKEHDRAQNIDSYSVRTNVPYAAEVEFGGYHRKPKPFLEQALEEARKSVQLVFSLTFGGDIFD